MADAVKALTHWRRGRDVERTQHTREVVRQELPEAAQAALVMMAERIVKLEERNSRLERVLGELVDEAKKGG